MICRVDSSNSITALAVLLPCCCQQINKRQHVSPVSADMVQCSMLCHTSKVVVPGCRDYIF